MQKLIHDRSGEINKWGGGRLWVTWISGYVKVPGTEPSRKSETVCIWKYLKVNCRGKFNDCRYVAQGFCNRLIE